MPTSNARPPEEENEYSEAEQIDANDWCCVEVRVAYSEKFKIPLWRSNGNSVQKQSYDSYDPLVALAFSERLLARLRS